MSGSLHEYLSPFIGVSLVEFFAELEMFWMKVVGKIKTYVTCHVHF
jgi:hypothetical protein